MSIGIGILLIVAGAILTFAVHVDVSGLDLHLIGWILMGAGVAVVLFSLIYLIPRSRRIRSTAVTTDQAGRQYITERDNRVDGM